MKTASFTIIVTAIVWLGSGLSYAADDQRNDPDAYDKYKIIFERNIFSKDRLPPRDLQRPGAAQVKVLAIYVLRGIAVEREKKVAFIEEQISGQSMKAQIGTEVLDGRITDIGFDRVTFEEKGQTRHIGIGGEFGKKETTILSTSTTESPPTLPAAEQVGDNPPEEEDDVLKKLMERRKSELGQ